MNNRLLFLLLIFCWLVPSPVVPGTAQHAGAIYQAEYRCVNLFTRWSTLEAIRLKVCC